MPFGLFGSKPKDIELPQQFHRDKRLGPEPTDPLKTLQSSLETWKSLRKGDESPISGLKKAVK